MVASVIVPCDVDVARYNSNAVPGGTFSNAWISLFNEMSKKVEAELEATHRDKAASAAEERMSGEDGISVWKPFLVPWFSILKEAQAAEAAQAKKEEEAVKEAKAGM